MPSYIFKAKQGPKKIIEDRIQADNLDSAVAKIMQLGYTPIDVQKEKTDAATRINVSLASLFGTRKKISALDMAIFTRSMSDLIEAGVPVLKSLTIVSKQSKIPAFKAMVSEMCQTVQDGGAFSSALEKHPQVFSKMYVNVVRSGELSGNLDVVMKRLADFIERDQQLRSQVSSSLLYPGFVFTVGVFVVIFLITWMIPKVTVLFEDMHQTLPLPTRMILSLSDFLVQYWWVIVILCVLAFIQMRNIYNTDHGRMRIDRFKLKMPVLGKFIEDAEIGQFARTLSTLLENGVVIVPALDAVGRVLNNEVLKKEIQNISQDVADGASLADAAGKSVYFSEDVISMISVGEQSGRLDDGLKKAGEFYERKTQRVIKGTLALLGPVILLGVGLTIGFVVLAMLLPILQMNLIVN